MTALRLSWTELGRLSRQRSGLLLLLLPGLVGGVRIAAQAWSRPEAADPAAAAGNGFAPLADGLHAGGVVLTLVTVLLGSLMIVRDRELGTLSMHCLIGSRGAVFLSKALTLLAVLVTGAVLLVGACLGAAAWWFDLGPLVEDGFEMASAGALWADVARAVGAAVPAWFAAGCLALAVSACTSNPGAAVLVSLVPVVLFDFLQGLLGGVWQHVFLVHVPFLGGSSMLARLPAVSRGYSDVFLEPGEIVQVLAVSSWQALALLVVGWLALRLRPAL